MASPAGAEQVEKKTSDRKSKVGANADADASRAAAATGEDNAAPQTIVVTGTARRDTVTGGALGVRSDLDTPFSARVVTADEIEERQVRSLARVFSQDASVVANGDTYTFNSYSQTIRGIPLDDLYGYRINGDPFYMTTVELPLESFEALQLLKGASGFLYGFNAPGGLINYQTKRPTPDTFVTADLGYSSNTVLLQHIDTGGPVAAGLGYRLNLTHEAGGTYSGSHVLRYSGSLGLDAQLTDTLLWTGDLIYQDRRIKGGTQDFFIDDPVAYGAKALPRPISGTTNLAAYPDLFFNSHVFYGATGLRWTAGPRWTVKADYSNSLDWRTYKAEWMPLINRDGDYGVKLNTNPRSWSRYNQAQVTLEGHFTTGPLAHQLTLGATWQDLKRYLPRDRLNTVIGSQNLYRPVTPVNYPSAFTDAIYRSYHSVQEGAFASDTISLGGVSVIGGLRVTRYVEHQYSKQGIVKTYAKSPVTPVAAVLYHPLPDATVYVSYVQALESGITVPDSFANARETLPPVMSDQIEVGAKVERPAWFFSTALYRIERGAQYANAANVYVSDGTQRYQGVEANWRVALPLDLSVANSVAIEEATYRKSEQDLQGRQVEGVPRFKDTVQVTERPSRLPGFSTTAELSHTARLWGNAVNTFRVPSTTLVNLRASYDIGSTLHALTLRAEVDNVANLHHWGYLGSGYVFVGEPRTVRLNASIKL
ncbi:TonB-dependent siderophore receptor [Sphingomonas sp. M6A6_1c]